MLRKIGERLARYLSAPRHQPIHVNTSAPGLLAIALQPGDVLLVEGNTIFSTAIKYLTQSNWSHAALYVGKAIDETDNEEMLHIKHHSLFTPRDFDVSPYFDIVKPTLMSSFDFHDLNWADESK